MEAKKAAELEARRAREVELRRVQEEQMRRAEEQREAARWSIRLLALGVGSNPSWCQLSGTQLSDSLSSLAPPFVSAL